VEESFAEDDDYGLETANKSFAEIMFGE